MGYPTGISAFTNKNAGDVIQPAHVNDLQTEVAAVETALLGTITHAVTLGATLSVAGGSTFAARPVMPPPEMALVFLQSTYAAGSSVLSTLAFLSESFVSNSSMHSSGANPERLVPQSTGVYQFVAQVAAAGAPSTEVILALNFIDSSGTTFGEARQMLSTIGTPPGTLVAVGYKRFDALGGHAKCKVTNAGPGTSTLSFSPGSGTTYFSMVKL